MRPNGVGMAKRKGRKKSTRRRTKSINILNTAELVVTSNILTTGLFNANLFEFVTGKTNYTAGPMNYGSTYRPILDDNILTLPEIFGLDMARQKLTSQTGYVANLNPVVVDFNPARTMAIVTANAKVNAGSMIMQTIGAKVFFKVAKRVTTKQRSAINKGLNFVGLKEVRA